MPKRRCRNPLRTDGLNMEEIITLAMNKLQWSREKCLSWYEKENASLNKSRPRELMERGDTDRIITLLNKREADRIKEQKGKKK